jgi:hypothetical protein
MSGHGLAMSAMFFCPPSRHMPTGLALIHLEILRRVPTAF